jgi:hypothetical protein
VEANATPTPRTGTITVNGQAFTLTQQGQPACGYALSQKAIEVPVGGGSGSFDVVTAAGCPWTAQSSGSVLKITSGASGTGPGAVTYEMTASTLYYYLDPYITVADQAVRFYQAGKKGCWYAFVPSTINVPATAGSGSGYIAADDGCTWTVSSLTSWLTVGPGTSGNGGGKVSFSVAANPDAAARTAQMKLYGYGLVSGYNGYVSQAGGGCSYTLGSSSASLDASGGTKDVGILTSASCTWTASSDASWLTLPASSGRGSGAIVYRVAANTSSAARTGTLTIAGLTFTVTQAGVACAYTLSTTTASFAAAGGSGQVTVSAASGCAWTAASSAAWLSVTAGVSGSGSGTVSYTAAANTDASNRSGTLTIAGRNVTVTQAGASSCSATVTPASLSLPAAGSSGALTVTVAGGCPWSGASNAGWLTITSGASGTGSGTVTYMATPNTSASIRTGTLTVGGQTVNVTQAAAGCAVRLNPTSVNLAATAATGQIAVTANCQWSASSNAAWLTVPAGASGAGNGTVTYTAAANTGAAARTATLTIGSATVAVTQSAAGCGATLESSSIQFPAGGGAGLIGVAIDAGCAWTAKSNTSQWLTVAPARAALAAAASATR